MSQQSKKSTNISGRKQHSAFNADTVRKTAKEVLEIERDGVESVMRAADDLNTVAEECTEICSDNVAALIASGNLASLAFQEMRNEMVESGNRAFSICTEIARERLSCKTINDVVELKTSAYEQLSDNYFVTTNKLCSMLFDSWSKALRPINDRRTAASEQIRKAMAA